METPYLLLLKTGSLWAFAGRSLSYES